MKIKLIFFLIAAVSLSSCSQIVDNYVDQKIRDSYVSPYAGTYVGTYSGLDSGTLIIEVSKKDYVTVTRHSDKFNTDETFYGGLTGASFQQVVSQKSGFRIEGNLISQTTTYNGTWSQNGTSGTWQIKKK